jgi:hypothetical protein
MIAALGARVHVIVRPIQREAFTALFRDVLQCQTRELDFGMPLPILLITFPDGSAMSAEFTGDDDVRGTWIEFRVADVAAVQARLEDAAIHSFTHPGSPHHYFTAPGGQVFRVIHLDYRGP